MSVEKFLKQRAVNVAVEGSYTLSNWYDPQGRPRTFTCRTNRVSPFRMIVDVPVVGKVGDPITSYFSDFGKLQGFISDTSSGSFLLELEMVRSMRAKLANKLIWLEKKGKDVNLTDARRHPRIVPSTMNSNLTFADGTMHDCIVIDMSASGVAVLADVEPQIGMPLAVGACVGRVIRLLPGGFAVRFVEPQKRSQLDRLIIRAATPQAAAGAAAVSRSDEAGVARVEA